MKENKTDWVKMKPAELEKLVIDLNKEGHSPSKIGLILRDKHGVPKAKQVGKKIVAILKENNLKYDSQKDVNVRKIKAIEVHIAAHKHDYTAKRSLTKNLWAVKKLD